MIRLRLFYQTLLKMKWAAIKGIHVNQDTETIVTETFVTETIVTLGTIVILATLETAKIITIAEVLMLIRTRVVILDQMTIEEVASMLGKGK